MTLSIRPSICTVLEVFCHHDIFLVPVLSRTHFCLSYLSCQSGVATLFLSFWQVSAWHCVEKGWLLYLRKPSTHLGWRPCHPCRFYCTQNVFFLVGLSAFDSSSLQFLPQYISPRAPSTALSCQASDFTRFLRLIHPSKYFQLICHESPLKVLLDFGVGLCNSLCLISFVHEWFTSLWKLVLSI